MSSIARVDPRDAVDEAPTVRGFLDHVRATIRRQAEGLDVDQLATPIGPSSMTLGGIVSHLAFVEDYWCGYVLCGREQREPWAGLAWESDPDADWAHAAGRDAAELDALLVAAVAESDGCLDAAPAVDGLGQESVRERHGERVGLRRNLLHLVEEHARHCGHADLLRESIEGRTDL